MQDEIYMRRALQLARQGAEGVRSNPMVGAVLVAPDGRIIGEGWHRRWGEGHAEVNAMRSVSDTDLPLLKASTLYVTLEPCSHWGKTPPCAQLLIDKGIRRVVIGHGDPFAKVNGHGIAMLREAGIEVVTDVLHDECEALNPHFFTAHRLQRPYVTLKWAQSADGWLDCERTPEHPESLKLSFPLTSLLVHDLRRTHQAIMIGSETLLRDRPALTVRSLEATGQPVRIILDRRGRLSSVQLEQMPPGGEIWHVTSRPFTDVEGVKTIQVPPDADMSLILRRLYDEGITSVLVEGGATILQALIYEGLYDEGHRETAPVKVSHPYGRRIPMDMSQLNGYECHCLNSHRVEVGYKAKIE